MKMKAKRKLSNISFQHDGAHVALTSKDQGGPANGHDYALVLKAGFSQEYIKKIQSVTVTMDLPDFLEKFFYVWGEEADVLASLMGYVEQEDNTQESKDKLESWAKDRFQSFEVMKSAKDSITSLATLTQEQYLGLVTDQAVLEKALEKYSAAKTAEEGSIEAVEKSKESNDVNQAKVEPSGVTKIEKKTMDEEQVVELQKSLDTTKVELQKALDKLAAFEAEQKAAVAKSKTEKVAAVVKDVKHVEAIAKAALSLGTDEEFDAFVTALTAVTKSVDNSSLFQEQGASTSEEVNKSAKSGVAKALEKIAVKK